MQKQDKNDRPLSTPKVWGVNHKRVYRRYCLEVLQMLLTIWWWPSMGFRNASRWAKAKSSSQLELNYAAYAHGVVLDCFRPDKPTDNAFIEAFNNRFWQECLNEHWFLSLEDAQEKIEGWRGHYNEHRPHSSLGYL
jgi:transposase InsO family protein